MDRIEAEYIKRNRLRESQFERDEPRRGRESTERLEPIVEQFDKACFSEQLAKSGPFYLRYFPIFPKDTPGFLFPDLTKDPRYGAPTKSGSVHYTSVDEFPKQVER